ncbi:hypothetical protein ABIB48_002995 [Arthrobacter sp. UYCu511]|uniref:hypothetical protein n=1 Tax=unclassified Arthrobacter TaxID=235627 RepID=UPI0028F6DB38|nr:hypothetical protein [Arthrobacter sp. lap29]
MSNTENFDPTQSPRVDKKLMEDSAGEPEVGKEASEVAQTPEPKDVESDPALNDGLGQDWTDEGGATAEGSATSSE